MQLTKFLLSTLGLLSTSLAAPAVETIDRTRPSPPPPIVGLINFWKGGGCAPQSAACNINFPIRQTGCYTVPKECAESATVIGMIDSCTVSLWTNDKCTSFTNYIQVSRKLGGIGNCEQPGPNIGSISAVCK